LCLLPVRTTPALSTLSLHDALPIFRRDRDRRQKQSAKERHATRVRPRCGPSAERRPWRISGLGGHASSRPSLVWNEPDHPAISRSEEHTSELQSRENLVCRLLLEKK